VAKAVKEDKVDNQQDLVQVALEEKEELEVILDHLVKFYL